MTRMRTMFSMKSTRLTHSLISIFTETRVSSFSTHPHACQKTISSVPTVELLRIPGKKVYSTSHSPTCSPSRIKNNPSFALRRKALGDFNQISEISIICTKLISFAFQIRRAAADGQHGKQRRPSPGPQPRPPWQRALTGTLSGYFFRIFSPSFFLYSNG